MNGTNATSRGYWSVVAGVAISFALVLSTTAPASASHAWRDYHWSRATNPLNLAALDSVTAGWDGLLDLVVADWNLSAVVAVAEEPSDDANATRKKCPTVTGKIRVCSATYGSNGWLGIAEIWVSGSHIVKGRARVNDSYFNTSKYNDENAKRHVLCQEVGHLFGLSHQTAVSCMDDRNGLFDPTYVSPNAHDYEQLDLIYAHLDAAVSTQSAPSGSGRGKATRDRGLTKITWIFNAR